MKLTLEMRNEIRDAPKELTSSAYLAWIDPFYKHGWNFSLHSSLAHAIDARFELLQEQRIGALDHATYGNLMDLDD